MLVFGDTMPNVRGKFSNKVTSLKPLMLLVALGMIACRAKPKGMLYRNLLPTAVQHNELAGSLVAFKLAILNNAIPLRQIPRVLAHSHKQRVIIRARSLPHN